MTAMRELLYLAGREIVFTWLDHNDIPRPIVLTYGDAGLASPLVWERRPGDRLEWDKKGLCFCGHVFVNLVSMCESAAGDDWPGHLVDDTAIGVLAHEVGHYVWHWLQLRTAPWSPAAAGGRRIGRYDYRGDPEEAWAETIRLFILNPALLKAGLPRRWRWLTGPDIRLRPLPQPMRCGWRSVLGDAACIKEAERWLRS